MIYQTLIAKIQSTLESVSAVKAIYPYPTTTIEKYPAVVFFPDAFENTFQSTADNFKVYRFRMYVVVGATQKDRVDIFNTVLPKTVDAVLAAFDSGWDGGTIDGHRIWLLINSGVWSMATSQNGLEATAEMTVEIRLATDI